METLEILQVIWFFLIGVLFIGYSILDGFDLGVGSILPFLAKDEKETGTLIKSIGPVWDGNEVWLITAGGALFAAFPHVYATVFSGFYLAMMLVLFSLIFRAVSLEFWSMDEERRHIWKWSIATGSFVVSILFGVALGNIIIGIPLNEAKDFTGNFFTLLRPFPLATGLLGLAAILMQGLSYTLLKTTGSLQERARAWASYIWLGYLALFFLAFLATLTYIPENLGKPVAWIGVVLFIVAMTGYRITLLKENDLATFLLSSTAFLGLWVIVGGIQFPNLVTAFEAPLNLTIYNSSSTKLTLTVMLIIALTGMPLVIGYQAYVYRIFRGKVEL